MCFARMSSSALWVAAVCFGFTMPLRADGLRNVKHGEPVPVFELATTKGQVYASKFSKGKTVVLLYLSAEQRSSERAAADANSIVTKLKRKDVELVFVTADIVHKSYFEKLWSDLKIRAPLCFDKGRSLYAKLGLIVFPTTIVVDKEGKLDHVLSTRGTNYPFLLDAYIRHTLGLFTDAKLKEYLKAKSYDRGSPKSIAARHRAAARLLREKGVLDTAEKELRKALATAPDNIHIKLDLADLLFEAHRNVDAEKIIDAVRKEDPRNRRAKLLKGIAWFKARELKKAEKILLDALVLNPDPARTHFFLGRIYEEMGKKDKALHHYKESIRRLLKHRDTE